MRTLCFLVLAGIPALPADSIRCVGVLGNSGEQGPTLVRFGDKPASGMGVAHDATGSLWDRAGADRLNRYAVDGRLLASYPLDGSGGPHDKDRLVLIGDILLMKLGNQLFTLRADAASGTAPAPLALAARRLSFNTRDGFAAAASGRSVFLVNPAGETKAAGESGHDVDDLEIGPDGGIFVSNSGKLHRLDGAAGGSLPSPGNFAQWLDGSWFGSAWHGTLRRFDAGLLPDPGVVLGGASGSFIGYVEGNHELNDCRGLARLRGPLFAASGSEGVMHLLEWRPQRFTILRRIGAVPSCSALSIDGKSRVWHRAGYWEWNDGPDSPLRHSTPPPDEPGFAGAATLPNGVTVSPGIRWGTKVLYSSTDGGPARLSDGVALPDGMVACAAFPIDGRQAVWVANSRGEGAAVFVGSEGTHEGPAGDFKLHGAVPIDGLTSLAAGEGVLYAAVKGEVIEFALKERNWRETGRWNSWGDHAADRFGASIHLACHDGRLWVSDSLRQRVICFDPATRRPLAVIGETDRAGDTLSRLHHPRAIAVRGLLAVVHDSANQRLMRLELKAGPH
jgi:hypothetical protein